MHFFSLLNRNGHEIIKIYKYFTLGNSHLDTQYRIKSNDKTTTISEEKNVAAAKLNSQHLRVSYYKEDVIMKQRQQTKKNY